MTSKEKHGGWAGDERQPNIKLEGVGAVAASKCMRRRLTCDFLSMGGAGDEDDIPLGRRNIAAFQKEEFIDTIVLQGLHLDDCSDGAGEALFDDEVLLALDLRSRPNAPSQ